MSERKQAHKLIKLARKQSSRTRRVEFARGVQSERGIAKTAKKEKRKSKAWRKSQEGVKRRKLSHDHRNAVGRRAEG